MLEDVISQVVELVGAEPLQLGAQGSELLVELGLVLSTNIRMVSNEIGLIKIIFILILVQVRLS